MQSVGIINDGPSNMEYTNKVVGLRENETDDNKGSVKTFKQVLSDQGNSDLEYSGYESDISSDNCELLQEFCLTNSLPNNDDGFNTNISLIDNISINFSDLQSDQADNDNEYEIVDNSKEYIITPLEEFISIQCGYLNTDTKKEIISNDINDFNKEEVFKEDVQQDNIVYITEENYNTAVIIDNNEDCIDAQNSNDNELETFNENLNHVKSSGIKENLNENIEQKNDEKEKFESEQKSLKNLTESANTSSNLNQKKKPENIGEKLELKIDNRKVIKNSNVLHAIFNKEDSNIKANEEINQNFNVVKSRVINDTKNAIAECVKTKEGEFDLYLEPKTLGVLKIKVSFKENNSIAVVFNASNSQALDILKQESTDIVNMISSLGFDVNSDSLNFNFSQNNSDSNFSKFGASRSNVDKSDNYIEGINEYKKICILNDQNVDVLV